MVETEGEKLAVAMAQKMLGTMVDELPNIPEQVSQGAKHQGHKFVDTANGPWVITHFKNGENEYVKAEPPKGSSKHPIFFLPRHTPNMNEGAVKHAIMDIIEKAIRKADVSDDYEKTLGNIAKEVSKLDHNNLTAGMTDKQVKDLIKPMYDETDHDVVSHHSKLKNKG
jgi:hypothetical protein